MSFGFSVGDFIAVAGLATTIYEALDEVGGSKIDFKDTTEQLQNLHIPIWRQFTTLLLILHLTSKRFLPQMPS
jgi:hypothetical protein